MNRIMCVPGFYSFPQIGGSNAGQHAQSGEMLSTLFGMFSPVRKHTPIMALDACLRA